MGYPTSFNAMIYANHFADEGGERHTLIWTRARRQNGDGAEPAATPCPEIRAGLLRPRGYAPLDRFS
jgi:hypothetical protein